MSDDLISKENAIRRNIDKIKVSSAEIVVHGTKEKPYYEIEYFDLSDNEIYIGFGSYKLDMVFEYLEKYFDIVNKENKPEHSHNHIIGDLISRKALLNRFKYSETDNETDKAWICTVRRIIKEMPTAFDKEMVIEKLKTNMNSFAGISGQAVTFMFSNGYYNGTKDAIEIVEKGGIE